MASKNFYRIACRSLYLEGETPKIKTLVLHTPSKQEAVTLALDTLRYSTKDMWVTVASSKISKERAMDLAKMDKVLKNF